MLFEPGDDAAHENLTSVHATSYDRFLPQVPKNLKAHLNRASN